ncbi:hypothetical protein ACN4EG_13510 [Alkalinema pantanalense CENA528]|uniref:hypothetical protein n=1 Tax=Alkalinema pantanalense TaxID=1620705 RepID=UPI003D6E3BF8
MSIGQYADCKIGQNQWDLDQVLPRDYEVPDSYLQTAPPGVLENFCRLLGRDVFSEADAGVLYEYLMARRSEFSSEFLGMLVLWLSDERKHYEALRRVYHGLSGVSFAEMDRRFGDRVHEIEPIARVLQDEFTILVTMMFDEIGSVYSYRRDLREYYGHFGPAIRKIGQHLIQDEGMHFNNAAELLLQGHRDRLDQVEPLLDEIAALELRLGRYYKTFFLDHAQEQFRFPPQFSRVIIRLILARLGLGTRPEPMELKALWQWVPEGCRLVPIGEDG